MLQDSHSMARIIAQKEGDAVAIMTRPKYEYHNGVRVKYIGIEQYVVCERCGKEIDVPNAKKRKYCEECASIVKREKNKERMARYKERQAQKDNSSGT